MVSKLYVCLWIRTVGPVQTNSERIRGGWCEIEVGGVPKFVRIRCKFEFQRTHTNLNLHSYLILPWDLSVLVLPSSMHPKTAIHVECDVTALSQSNTLVAGTNAATIDRPHSCTVILLNPGTLCRVGFRMSLAAFDRDAATSETMALLLLLHMLADWSGRQWSATGCVSART